MVRGGPAAGSGRRGRGRRTLLQRTVAHLGAALWSGGTLWPEVDRRGASSVFTTAVAGSPLCAECGRRRKAVHLGVDSSVR
ncbi:MAG: hypothetical protein OEQ18_02520, partial [Gammaproteobacteria bacterium]|nr:hypothetical protein [Gammaproteobacteria bacterium]